METADRFSFRLKANERQDVKEKSSMKKKVFPISMAVLWGMAFGTALHSWTLGICMGLMMGIAFGLFDSENNDRDQE